MANNCKIPATTEASMMIKNMQENIKPYKMITFPTTQSALAASSPQLYQIHENQAHQSMRGVPAKLLPPRGPPACFMPERAAFNRQHSPGCDAQVQLDPLQVLSQQRAVAECTAIRQDIVGGSVKQEDAFGESVEQNETSVDEPFLVRYLNSLASSEESRGVTECTTTRGGRGGRREMKDSVSEDILFEIQCSGMDDEDLLERHSRRSTHQQKQIKQKPEREKHDTSCSDGMKSGSIFLSKYDTDDESDEELDLGNEGDHSNSDEHLDHSRSYKLFTGQPMSRKCAVNEFTCEAEAEEPLEESDPPVKRVISHSLDRKSRKTRSVRRSPDLTVDERLGGVASRTDRDSTTEGEFLYRHEMLSVRRGGPIYAATSPKGSHLLGIEPPIGIPANLTGPPPLQYHRSISARQSPSTATGYSRLSRSKSMGLLFDEYPSSHRSADSLEVNRSSGHVCDTESTGCRQSVPHPVSGRCCIKDKSLEFQECENCGHRSRKSSMARADVSCSNDSLDLSYYSSKKSPGKNSPRRVKHRSKSLVHNYIFGETQRRVESKTDKKLGESKVSQIDARDQSEDEASMDQVDTSPRSRSDNKSSADSAGYIRMTSVKPRLSRRLADSTANDNSELLNSNQAPPHDNEDECNCSNRKRSICMTCIHKSSKNDNSNLAEPHKPPRAKKHDELGVSRYMNNSPLRRPKLNPYYASGLERKDKQEREFERSTVDRATEKLAKKLTLGNVKRSDVNYSEAGAGSDWQKNLSDAPKDMKYRVDVVVSKAQTKACRAAKERRTSRQARTPYAAKERASMPVGENNESNSCSHYERLQKFKELNKTLRDLLTEHDDTVIPSRQPFKTASVPTSRIPRSSFIHDVISRRTPKGPEDRIGLSDTSGHGYRNDLPVAVPNSYQVSSRIPSEDREERKRLGESGSLRSILKHHSDVCVRNKSTDAQECSDTRQGRQSGTSDKRPEDGKDPGLYWRSANISGFRTREAEIKRKFELWGIPYDGPGDRNTRQSRSAMTGEGRNNADREYTRSADRSNSPQSNGDKHNDNLSNVYPAHMTEDEDDTAEEDRKVSRLFPRLSDVQDQQRHTDAFEKTDKYKTRSLSTLRSDYRYDQSALGVTKSCLKQRCSPKQDVDMPEIQYYSWNSNHCDNPEFKGASSRSLDVDCKTAFNKQNFGFAKPQKRVSLESPRSMEISNFAYLTDKWEVRPLSARLSCEEKCRPAVISSASTPSLRMKWRKPYHQLSETAQSLNRDNNLNTCNWERSSLSRKLQLIRRVKESRSRSNTNFTQSNNEMIKEDSDVEPYKTNSMHCEENPHIVQQDLSDDMGSFENDEKYALVDGTSSTSIMTLDGSYTDTGASELESYHTTHSSVSWIRDPAADRSKLSTVEGLNFNESNNGRKSHHARGATRDAASAASPSSFEDDLEAEQFFLAFTSEQSSPPTTAANQSSPLAAGANPTNPLATSANQSSPFGASADQATALVNLSQLKVNRQRSVENEQIETNEEVGAQSNAISLTKSDKTLDKATSTDSQGARSLPKHVVTIPIASEIEDEGYHKLDDSSQDSLLRKKSVNWLQAVLRELKELQRQVGYTMDKIDKSKSQTFRKSSTQGNVTSESCYELKVGEKIGRFMTDDSCIQTSVVSFKTEDAGGTKSTEDDRNDMNSLGKISKYSNNDGSMIANKDSDDDDDDDEDGKVESDEEHKSDDEENEEENESHICSECGLKVIYEQNGDGINSSVDVNSCEEVSRATSNLKSGRQSRQKQKQTAQQDESTGDTSTSFCHRCPYYRFCQKGYTAMTCPKCLHHHLCPSNSQAASAQHQQRGSSANQLFHNHHHVCGSRMPGAGCSCGDREAKAKCRACADWSQQVTSHWPQQVSSHWPQQVSSSPHASSNQQVGSDHQSPNMYFPQQPWIQVNIDCKQCPEQHTADHENSIQQQPNGQPQEGPQSEPFQSGPQSEPFHSDPQSEPFHSDPQPGPQHQGLQPGPQHEDPPPGHQYQGPQPGHQYQCPQPGHQYQGPGHYYHCHQPGPFYQVPQPGTFHQGLQPGPQHQGSQPGPSHQGPQPGLSYQIPQPEPQHKNPHVVNPQTQEQQHGYHHMLAHNQMNQQQEQLSTPQLWQQQQQLHYHHCPQCHKQQQLPHSFQQQLGQQQPHQQQLGQQQLHQQQLGQQQSNQQQLGQQQPHQQQLGQQQLYQQQLGQQQSNQQQLGQQQPHQQQLGQQKPHKQQLGQQQPHQQQLGQQQPHQQQLGQQPVPNQEPPNQFSFVPQPPELFLHPNPRKFTWTGQEHMNHQLYGSINQQQQQPGPGSHLPALPAGSLGRKVYPAIVVEDVFVSERLDIEEGALHPECVAQTLQEGFPQQNTGQNNPLTQRSRVSQQKSRHESQQSRSHESIPSQDDSERNLRRKDKRAKESIHGSSRQRSHKLTMSRRFKHKYRKNSAATANIKFFDSELNVILGGIPAQGKDRRSGRSLRHHRENNGRGVPLMQQHALEQSQVWQQQGQEQPRNQQRRRQLTSPHQVEVPLEPQPGQQLSRQQLYGHNTETQERRKHNDQVRLNVSTPGRSLEAPQVTHGTPAGQPILDASRAGRAVEYRQRPGGERVVGRRELERLQEKLEELQEKQKQLQSDKQQMKKDLEQLRQHLTNKQRKLPAPLVSRRLQAPATHPLGLDHQRAQSVRNMSGGAAEMMRQCNELPPGYYQKLLKMRKQKLQKLQEHQQQQQHQQQHQQQQQQQQQRGRTDMITSSNPPTDTEISREDAQQSLQGLHGSSPRSTTSRRAENRSLSPRSFQNSSVVLSASQSPRDLAEPDRESHLQEHEPPPPLFSSSTERISTAGSGSKTKTSGMVPPKAYQLYQNRKSPVYPGVPRHTLEQAAAYPAVYDPIAHYMEAEWKKQEAAVRRDPLWAAYPSPQRWSSPPPFNYSRTPPSGTYELPHRGTQRQDECKGRDVDLEARRKFYEANDPSHCGPFHMNDPEVTGVGACEGFPSVGFLPLDDQW